MTIAAVWMSSRMGAAALQSDAAKPVLPTENACATMPVPPDSLPPKHSPFSVPHVNEHYPATDEPVHATSLCQTKDGAVYLQDASRQSVGILLVEDDTVQALFVKAALADLPQLHLMAVARDGSEAVAWLRRRLRSGNEALPDIILLDLNMPNMDGFQVLAELKSSPLLRRIPVVVFSTSCDQEDVDRAYEEGANSYVVKPARLDELKQSLGLVASYWANATRLPTRATMTGYAGVSREPR